MIERKTISDHGERYEVFCRKTGDAETACRFVAYAAKIEPARETRERWWTLNDMVDVWIIDRTTGKRVP